MPVDDVADSTDWLTTPLSGLAAVEAALRCQVCKDFYKTPMLTSCSHTFCSICIRRALSSDGKCPLCRAADQELKLRSNWSMEEAVDAFTKARASAIEFANRPPEVVVRGKSPKRKAPTDDDAESGTGSQQQDSKRLRTSARLSGRAGPATVVVVPPRPEYVEEIHDTDEEEEAVSSGDDEYTPEISEFFFPHGFCPRKLTMMTDDGLVACPLLCKKRMKEALVFQHLDTCTGPSSEPPAAPTTPFGGQQQRTQQRTYERLPALNYSMLKEQFLRKKLAEVGISNMGSRQLLERRHKEWITIWNSNCDAANPRGRSDLLRDLDSWERTQGGKAPTTSKAIQNAIAIKDKDFDGAGWAAKHDDSFQDLIAKARNSRLEAKRKSDEAKKEEEEKQAAAVAAQGQDTPMAELHQEQQTVVIISTETNGVAHE